jgi:hypothetical protein
MGYLKQRGINVRNLRKFARRESGKSRMTWLSYSLILATAKIFQMKFGSY